MSDITPYYSIQKVLRKAGTSKPITHERDGFYFIVVDPNGKHVGTPCTREEFCEHELRLFNSIFMIGFNAGMNHGK